MRNKGHETTYEYYNDHVVITHPPGERKARDNSWADIWDANRVVKYTYDEIDAITKENDELRVKPPTKNWQTWH